jgi:hypothetical protein
MIDAIDVTVDVDMSSEQVEALRQDLWHGWLTRRQQTRSSCPLIQAPEAGHRALL